MIEVGYADCWILLMQLGNAMTAMRRLSQFLIMEERADEVEKLPSPGAIIAEGNFYWAEATKPKVCRLRSAGHRLSSAWTPASCLCQFPPSCRFITGHAGGGFIHRATAKLSCCEWQDKPKGRKAKRAAKKAALVASRQVADSASSKAAADEKLVELADGEKVAVTLKGMDGDEEDTDEASDVIENVKLAVAPKASRLRLACLCVWQTVADVVDDTSSTHATRGVCMASSIDL